MSYRCKDDPSYQLGFSFVPSHVALCRCGADVHIVRCRRRRPSSQYRTQNRHKRGEAFFSFPMFFPSYLESRLYKSIIIMFQWQSVIRKILNAEILHKDKINPTSFSCWETNFSKLERLSLQQAGIATHSIENWIRRCFKWVPARPVASWDHCLVDHGHGLIRSLH